MYRDQIFTFGKSAHFWVPRNRILSAQIQKQILLFMPISPKKWCIGHWFNFGWLIGRLWNWLILGIFLAIFPCIFYKMVAQQKNGWKTCLCEFGLSAFRCKPYQEIWQLFEIYWHHKGRHPKKKALPEKGGRGVYPCPNFVSFFHQVIVSKIAKSGNAK